MEVERSGLVESRHRGVLVHVPPDGTVDWAIGDPDTVIFPRSANKPIQALAMLEAGLPLEGPELAIATSSHHGELMHLEQVRAVLWRAGLDESALQTPASWPDSPHEHARIIREGGGKAPILMDCSGKHAAMLLTCVLRGWTTHDYLEPEHPAAAPYLAVRRALEQRGIPLFALAPERRMVPAEFVNAGHLNDHGAQRFSAALGAALAGSPAAEIQRVTGP